MSAKWIRSKQWDDRHLTGALWPVKFLVRTFSEIPTAIVLLLLVVIYGIMASIPVGLIAIIPTKLFYGATFLAALCVGAVLPVWLITRAMRGRGVGKPVRFVTAFVGLALLAALSVAAWQMWVWPAIRFDPLTGKGVRFFAEFIARYQAVQARRLPGMEMSELEFYSWWPLRVVLLLFVVNLVVATVRRIEFSFPYIGVLMVHTGIVTIALGSVYYAAHKQEGDMILLAGGVDDSGTPAPGPAQPGFYDNTQTALWVTQDPVRGWEQRRLEHVPRYNDYNLDVIGRAEPLPAQAGAFGPLNIQVPQPPHDPAAPGVVDPSLRFRIVGYAAYADLAQQWVPGSGAPGGAGVATRTVEAWITDPNAPATIPKDRPAKVWTFLPDVPAERLDSMDVLAVEYTRGMDEKRWTALRAKLPAPTAHMPAIAHALVVEVPGVGGGSGFRAVYPAQPGQQIAVGDTGYTITVREVMDRPPFPIVTKGYQGATSSVAVVSVLPPPAPPVPPATAVTPRPAFERWIYHRFPEIAQDLLNDAASGDGQGGMGGRRAADPGIRIDLVDASMIQVYLDERADGTVRSLVRLPGAEAVVAEDLKVGESVQVAPSLKLKLAERTENARRVEVPVPVAPEMQDKQRIGNHQASAAAVEVSDASGVLSIVWVPFTQYLGVGSDGERIVQLGDGKAVRLAFGRVFHEFVPKMSVRLLDFEMTPYPHSDVPQNYASKVLVSGMFGGGGTPNQMERMTSLNEPLLVRMDFQGRDDLPQPARAVVNGIGRLASLVVPNQYKFSQAGWDQAGWRETAAAVQAGELKRPFARFTILGVGNNPGIYIIAAGAIMMSVGIPWAFYLKPWIMKRRKRKIQEQVARGEWKKPVSANEPVRYGEEVSV